MNGQYLYNFPITVEGHKKDSKGECHGSAAEQLVAAQNHSPRLTTLISCLPMHPLHHLHPILWYHLWGLGFLLHACLLLVLSHPQYHLLEPST